MKIICLGEIVAAHGIKGYVKIKTHTNNPIDIGAYGPLSDEKGLEYKLSNIRQASSNSAIAFIQGVTDRNQAEALKGLKLFIDRIQLPESTADEYYHEDLVGLNVRDERGEVYGTILGIQNFGAGEFFDIKSKDHVKIMTLPFNKDTIIEINTQERFIIINPEFLLV